MLNISGIGLFIGQIGCLREGHREGVGNGGGRETCLLTYLLTYLLLQKQSFFVIYLFEG